MHTMVHQWDLQKPRRMSSMHSQGGLPIPNIEHINQPYWYGDGENQDPEDFGKQRALELEEKINELGPENVGAFIGEPVQGAGGVIIPPDQDLILA